MADKSYTIDELVAMTGFGRRTVRFYVQEGILEPPAGRGRGGFYYDTHVQRLRQIKELQEQGLSLAAIRGLSEGPAEPLIPERREVWARYEVVPGLELNVSRDLEDKKRKKIAEILRIARSLLKEDESHE